MLKDKQPCSEWTDWRKGSYCSNDTCYKTRWKKSYSFFKVLFRKPWTKRWHVCESRYVKDPNNNMKHTHQISLTAWTWNMLFLLTKIRRIYCQGSSYLDLLLRNFLELPRYFRAYFFFNKECCLLQRFSDFHIFMNLDFCNGCQGLSFPLHIYLT